MTSIDTNQSELTTYNSPVYQPIPTFWNALRFLPQNFQFALALDTSYYIRRKEEFAFIRKQRESCKSLVIKHPLRKTDLLKKKKIVNASHWSKKRKRVHLIGSCELFDNWRSVNFCFFSFLVTWNYFLWHIMSTLKSVIITLPKGLKKDSGLISTDLRSGTKLNFTTSILADKLKLDNRRTLKHMEDTIMDTTILKQEPINIRGKKRRLDHLTWEEKLQRKYVFIDFFHHSKLINHL